METPPEELLGAGEAFRGDVVYDYGPEEAMLDHGAVAMTIYRGVMNE